MCLLSVQALGVHTRRQVFTRGWAMLDLAWACLPAGVQLLSAIRAFVLGYLSHAWWVSLQVYLKG